MLAGIGTNLRAAGGAEKREKGYSNGRPQRSRSAVTGCCRPYADLLPVGVNQRCVEVCVEIHRVHSGSST